MNADLSEKLKDILELEREPVAIKWSPKEPRNMGKESEKSRFCTKLDKAMNGEIFYSTAEEEECLGGARYSGMKDISEFPANMRSGAFLTQMGVHKDIPAVQRAWSHYRAMDKGLFSSILFAPLAKAEFEADVIFIVCNSQQGMEILHANSYDGAVQAIGADVGPICSTMAALPYMTGQVTYGFAEVGARNNMEIKPEEVMVAIPASQLERIVSNLEVMRNTMMFKKN
jgi:uncharacterized protein (DUF169 family)